MKGARTVKQPQIEATVSSERIAAVAQALRSLPPMPRAVFSLHAIYERSYADIAAMFFTDAATIQAELATALVLLDEALCRSDPEVAPKSLGSEAETSLDTP
jgi:DNA-directed RNA polymerase specialized sigma24 family protein